MVFSFLLARGIKAQLAVTRQNSSPIGQQPDRTTAQWLVARRRLARPGISPIRHQKSKTPIKYEMELFETLANGCTPLAHVT